MKKKNWSFWVLPLLLVLGCTKSALKTDSKTKNVLDEEFVMTHALEYLSGADKVLAYNTLSDSAKHDYWIERIQTFIEEQGIIRQDQLDLLDELAEELTYTVFSNYSAKQLFFQGYFLEFLHDAETYFEDWQIVILSDLLSDPAQAEDSPNKFDLGGEDVPSCICRLNSTWTCKKTTISVLGGIEITYGVCEVSNQNPSCQTTNYGCGFMGLWDCNGNHCVFS